MKLSKSWLMKSENAGQVIGVIAHETGHIAGGHVTRAHEEMNKSGNRPITRPLFVSYLRTQEATADQATVGLIDSTGQSARGLVAFFWGVLEDQKLLPPNRHQWLAACVGTTSTVESSNLGPKEHSTCEKFT